VISHALMAPSRIPGVRRSRQTVSPSIARFTYPVQSLFIAYKAVREMVKELRATGTIANLAQRTPSLEEFNEFIGAKEATQLAEKYRIVSE
jgi:2-methylisocitrate lyase-like PEP mutase family enzyme